MGPEAKLYQKLKKNFIGFSLIRLENLSLLGTPDLLVYNNNRHFFTIELKVTKSKKVRFSPHQIAFHLRHPTNTFIIVEPLVRGPRILFLYPCTMVPGSGSL
jgi:Holliday junction resolvase